jgi:hypothetical protein
MDHKEGIAIVLVLVLMVAAAAWWRKSLEADFDYSTARGSSSAPPAGWPSISDQSAALRAQQNDQLARRAGVRNDTAGYGSQRVPHQHDVRTRNGPTLSPEKVASAEQQAWAPYTPDATTHYDPTVGSYPGTDLTQQLGQHQSGDWSDQLSNIAVDARTQANHLQWANEVGPFSQGAMTVDNLDEAMVMSMPRQGITAFRALAPAQGPGTLHVTEIDPTHHTDHFSKMYF